MNNETTMRVRRESDGTLVEILANGATRELATPAGPDPLTDAEVEAAARADPDAQPLTIERLALSPRVPHARTLRRVLGLTQEEFAARYQIPLGTLRDWEQGRIEPDQPARAYLRAIAGNPGAVERALHAGPA